MRRPLFVVMTGMVIGEITVFAAGNYSWILTAVIAAALLWSAAAFRADSDNSKKRIIPIFPRISKHHRTFFIFIIIGSASFIAGQLLLFFALPAKGIEQSLYGSYILKPLIVRHGERRQMLRSGDVFVGRKESIKNSQRYEGIRGRIAGRAASVREKNGRCTIVLRKGAFLYVKGAYKGSNEGESAGKPNDKMGYPREGRPGGDRYVPYRIRGKCILYTSACDLLPGDSIIAGGEAKALEEPSNPGEFPMKIYRLSQGIRMQFYADKLQITGRPAFSPAGAGYRLQRIIAAGYERHFSPYEHAILKAMALGDKSGLSDEDRILYEENGAAHLLSLSGLHVSVAAGIIFKLLRKRRIGYGLSCLCGICFLAAYGLVVSGGSSLIRASLMFAVFLLAEYTGAEYDMISAMALSAIIMLPGSPFCVFDGGCIISFVFIAAIGLTVPAGLSLLTPESAETSQKPSDESKKEGIARKVLIKTKAGLLTGLILAMASAPVITAVYYEWAPVSVLLNLIILPSMPALMISAVLGGILFLLAFAFTFLPLLSAGIDLLSAKLACLPAIVLIKSFRMLFTFTKKIPGALIVASHLSPMQIILIYAGELTALYLWHKHRKALFPAAACLAAILIFWPASPELGITMLDIGQGDSVLIQCPDRRTILVDSGSTSEKEIFRYTLSSALKYYGRLHLDYVVISHFDEDHISGIREMLEKHYPIGALLISRAGPQDLYDKNRIEILRLARKNKVAVYEMKRGDSLHIGEVSLTCLHSGSSNTASAGAKAQTEPDRNAESLVFYLRWKQFDALFTGDIAREEEIEILSYLQKMKADNPDVFPEMRNGITFLKCAHHGSNYSSVSEFLRGMRPVCTGISAGRGNRYGHPGEMTLQRLKESGCTEVLCTIWGGAVLIKTDGIKTRAGYQ